MARHRVVDKSHNQWKGVMWSETRAGNLRFFPCRVGENVFVDEDVSEQ